MREWYSQQGDNLILLLYVQPGAKHTVIAGLHDDRLKIRLKAQAIEGAANAALIEFLAEVFDVARSRVNLISGHESRLKRVEILGVSAPPESLKLIT